MTVKILWAVSGANYVCHAHQIEMKLGIDKKWYNHAGEVSSCQILVFEIPKFSDIQKKQKKFNHIIS